MPKIAIIGGGVGGTQLGLFLLKHGITPTLYSEKTPAQHRAARLSNVVVRNGPTRVRERSLGIDYWDSSAPDFEQLVIAVNGPRPLSFSGALEPTCHVVDMRMYWARLLEELQSRGGDVRFSSVTASDVEQISTDYDLTVVASGHGSLSTMFERRPEHSPFQSPQRLVAFGLFRGIRYPKPLSFSATVTRGHGEILAFPMLSRESGLTAVAFEGAEGGAFRALSEVKFDSHPKLFEATVLDLLQEYSPPTYERIDVRRFAVTEPRDVGYVAITPTVRRAYARLQNGRWALAIGDAHIVMDPVTGQGANKASHAAFLAGAAICDASVFDEAFCSRVEQQMCEYALPVSDACNARLVPPTPHVAGLLGAAAQHQNVADYYTHGFNHPDTFWKVLVDEGRTEEVKRRLLEQTTV